MSKATLLTYKVKDQEEALEAVDIAGIVTLRPVLACQADVTPADLGDQLPRGPNIHYRRWTTNLHPRALRGSGEVFERGSAQAQINQLTNQWIVSVDLRSDSQQIWNALAAECYSATESCPTRQLAIVLDNIIQSAPTVNQPSFPTGVEISGAFTEDEVRSLARVLNRGAFPVGVEASGLGPSLLQRC